MTIPSKIGLGSFLVAALLTLPACDHPSNVTTQAAGHAVHARITGAYAIDAQTNRAVISNDYGRVTIHANQVQLDNNPPASIPPGVPVTLAMSRNSMKIIAGSLTISQSSR
jgi:hypothetical protein